MRVAAGIDVAAAPAQVFPWIADPEKAVRWQHDVVEQEILSAAPGMVGTTFREVVADGGGRLEMRGTITRYLGGETIGFHLESRIHVVDVTYSIGAEGSATRVAVEADVRWKFPMNAVSLLFGRRMKSGFQAQLEAELVELKSLAESSARS